jgi:hypothetical protein
MQPHAPPLQLYENSTKTSRGAFGMGIFSPEFKSFHVQRHDQVCDARARRYKSSRITNLYTHASYKHTHARANTSIRTYVHAKASINPQIYVDIRTPSSRSHQFRESLKAQTRKYHGTSLIAW